MYRVPGCAFGWWGCFSATNGFSQLGARCAFLPLVPGYRRVNNTSQLPDLSDATRG